MKKVLSIVLTALLLMSFAVGFSYADDTVTEEQEIINAADEAMRVFECLTGHCLDKGIFYAEPLELFSISESASATDDIIERKYYTKTVISMEEPEEYLEIVDKYLVDYSIDEKYCQIYVADEEPYQVIDREVVVPRDKYNGNLPCAVIYNDTLYVKNHVGLAYTVCLYGDVKNGKIVSYNGNTAVIEYNIVDGVESSGTNNGILHSNVTVEVTKVDGKWKISGGTGFSEYFDNRFKWTDQTPQTGENTFFYIVISASALACMTTLLARRRRERV